MRAPMPAEACTELGHSDTPRAHNWRLLLVLCVASWLVPLATLAVISAVLP